MRTKSRSLCAIAAMAAIAAGCGSATNSANSLSNVQNTALTAQEKVRLMVLESGDVPGFTVHQAAFEKRSEQYTKPGNKNFRAMRSLIDQSWLASYHSILYRGAAGHRFVLLSGVNLMRSPQAATRWMALDTTPDPHMTLRWVTPPAGVPAHAQAAVETFGGYDGYVVTWSQGSTTAGDLALFRHVKHTPASVQRKVFATLAAAAMVQQRRISSTLS